MLERALGSVAPSRTRLSMMTCAVGQVELLWSRWVTCTVSTAHVTWCDKVPSSSFSSREPASGTLAVLYPAVPGGVRLRVALRWSSELAKTVQALPLSQQRQPLHLRRWREPCAAVTHYASACMGAWLRVQGRSTHVTRS